MTHLIIGDETRTLKVLFALANHAFILRKDYLYASIEAGEWLPESKFESDHYPKFAIRQQPLFKEMEFFVGFRKASNGLTKDIFEMIIE